MESYKIAKYISTGIANQNVPYKLLNKNCKQN